MSGCIHAGMDELVCTLAVIVKEKTKVERGAGGERRPGQARAGLARRSVSWWEELVVWRGGACRP